MLILFGITLSLIFYAGLILTHILILFYKIPYTLVNGGRNQSFIQQQKLSVFSIVIAIIGSGFISFYWILPDIINHSVYIVILGLLTMYWFLGVFLQFLGTWFEKYFMSLLALLGFIGHLLYFIALLMN